MKKDLEYNLGQEYQALPDEHLQGAGKIETTKKSSKITWKKMIFTVASVLFLAHIAELPDTVSSSDTPDVSKTVISDQKESVSQNTETKEPTGEQENSTQVQENQVVEELPTYPIEDYTSYYTVYNDTYDFETRTGKIIEQGFLFESLLIQGMNYPLPEPEKKRPDFMVWSSMKRTEMNMILAL